MLDESVGDLPTTADHLHLMAAETLRSLSVAEPLVLNGSADPLRSVLRHAAEVCEKFGEMQRKSIRASARIAELEGLLARVAEALETEPLPVDGGSWAALRASQDIRRVLDRGEPRRDLNGPFRREDEGFGRSRPEHDRRG